MAPRSIAASVGFEPDGAADRGHHPVGIAFRRFHQPGFAGGGLDAGAGEGRLKVGIGGGIGDYRHAGADLTGDLGERAGIAAGRDGLDAVAVAVAFEQIDGAGADRAGGAENGHAAQVGGGTRLGTGYSGNGHDLTIPASRGQRRQIRHGRARSGSR